MPSHRSTSPRLLKGLSILGGFLAGPAAADPGEDYRKRIVPLLESYCFDCHADGAEKGGFSMDSHEDLNRHLSDRKHWGAVWHNLRSQIMPPSDKDQPSVEEKRELLSWIEKQVFKLDPNQPDPGRVTIRRLNRTEYRNAVFDLLGVEYDTTEVFPPDDTGYGFDNIGDVLTLSPLLMEKYLSAAHEVVDLALPKGADAQVPRREISANLFRSTDDPAADSAWLPFSKRQTLSLQHDLPADGEYLVKLEYSIHGATEATTDEARLEFSAGGSSIGSVTLGWDQRRVIELSGKAKLGKGPQSMELGILPGKRPHEGEEELFLRIRRVIVQGPLGGTMREYAKGYRMIFPDGPPPDDAKARERYARKIMRGFVSRAFRKPLDEATIDRLLKIVREVDAEPGADFQDGIKEAIAACLSSPRFLFRVEMQPEPDNPAKVVPLDEYSLASRLSFFLWGSVPDDELLSLAFRKELRSNLRQQVDRMLADPRSARLVSSFVGQWLQARDVGTVPVSAKDILGLSSNREAARVFDPRLRDDMRRETEMLFDHILRSGRPLEELISARYSFLNGRLARFYGIAGVEGEAFRAVDLTEHPERGGLLTQGTVLMVTSNPTRTSPVKRGLFVLDNLLGTPPPPAPPGIPPLEDAAKDGARATMREMMEVHRSKPECRGCHARMDPIGLGMENFDALGRYRSTEHGKPIDTSGRLVTGEPFADIATLKSVLATDRRRDLYRCVSEKLLTFAIGRGMEYYDATTIDQLTRHLENHRGSLRELIQAIVECAPFQKRRGDG